MSWLVCESQQTNNLKELLGASERSESDDVSLCVTSTPDERIFIFEARGRDWTFCRDDERRRLSAGRSVYFCMLEEHVMASEIALWRDGSEVWRVEHNSEEGVYHLDARGSLPPSFESVKQKRVDEHDTEGGEECGVDFVISVPMDLAQEFTGYDGN